MPTKRYPARLRPFGIRSIWSWPGSVDSLDWRNGDAAVQDATPSPAA